MADSYSSLTYHFVFSTKHRERWISSDVEKRVWEFLGGILKKKQMTPLKIGGIEDHVHVLVTAPATLAPCEIAKQLKGASSLWIHKNFPELAGFGWQDGYAVFSVSKSSIPEVTAYIQNQREHHHKRTFAEEYEAFLQRHHISYNSEYLLG